MKCLDTDFLIAILRSGETPGRRRQTPPASPANFSPTFLHRAARWISGMQ